MAITRRRERKLKPIKCRWCAKEFQPHWRGEFFCQNSCRLSHLHESGKEKVQFFGLNCWTDAEYEKLKLWENPNNSIEVLCSLLPGRSERAIQHKLNLLGIKRKFGSNTERFWSDERKEWFSNKIKGEGNPFFGKQHSESTKKILSEKATRQDLFRKLSKDSEFQRKRRAALYAKPNKEEKLLDSIIQKACPGEYKFVGDGNYIIDGLNPDWVHTNGQKKVIELFGRSFHDPAYCAWPVPYRSTEQGRRQALEKQGYDMLVIWDNELYKSKLPMVEKKIKQFTKRRKDNEN